MYRVQQIVLLLIALSGAAIVLSNCAPSVWKNYEACSEHGSFVAYADCAKARRVAVCKSAIDCSSRGATIVQFTDALALQVKNREMSDGEAFRRFAEFKTKVIADDDRDDAVIAGAMIGSRPRTCTPAGRGVQCF
jgi:hypothetical protein